MNKENNKPSIEAIRHSCAHILAMAVKEIYGNKVQITIGPIIENGFYYDFAKEEPFKPEDLMPIEQKMKELIKKDIKFEREEWSREKAIEFFENQGEKYKVEIIKDLPTDEKITVYKQGDFYDLCRGPHVNSSKEIGAAFKLTKIAGAYWRGDSNNEMLQRIYGVCFATKDELAAYFTMMEEAEKRDHRKLGKEMDLYHFEDYAPGDVFWHNKGWTLYNTLVNFERKAQHAVGYEEINTPQIMDRSLWEKSGHWGWYKENMFTTVIDDRHFAVKPMSCPGSMLVFKQGITSYRDLPRYLAEFGKVHRYESSGALHGLMRVRAFTQDDAHIFCTEAQFKEECQKVVKLMLSIYEACGMTGVEIFLSTRPEKKIGTDEIWDVLEKGLAEALTEMGYKYTLNPGDGAFYGPKLDFKFKDAIGREWQLGTLQADLNLPERFDLNYIGVDGEKHRPFMLHRALFGSIERTIGVLIEHYAGKLPVWMAPTQMVLATITDEANDFAKKLKKELEEIGVRVEMDLRNEKINYKIREHALKKVPILGIIGKREAEEGKVTLRRLGIDAQETLSKADLLKKLKEEIKEPEIKL